MYCIIAHEVCVGFSCTFRRLVPCLVASPSHPFGRATPLALLSLSYRFIFQLNKSPNKGQCAQIARLFSLSVFFSETASLHYFFGVVISHSVKHHSIQSFACRGGSVCAESCSRPVVLPSHGRRAGLLGPRLRERSGHRHGVSRGQTPPRGCERGCGRPGPSRCSGNAGGERHGPRGSASAEPPRGALHGVERFGRGLRLFLVPGSGLLGQFALFLSSRSCVSGWWSV